EVGYRDALRSLQLAGESRVVRQDQRGEDERGRKRIGDGRLLHDRSPPCEAGRNVRASPGLSQGSKPNRSDAANVARTPIVYNKVACIARYLVIVSSLH